MRLNIAECNSRLMGQVFSYSSEKSNIAAARFGCLINMKFPGKVFVNDNTQQFVIFHSYSSLLSHMTLRCVLSSLFFLYVVINIILVLSQFIVILLFLHHLLTLAISGFSLTSRSSIVFPLARNVESSAYIFSDESTWSGRSLMKTMKSKGSSILPWGTPCIYFFSVRDLTFELNILFTVL